MVQLFSSDEGNLTSQSAFHDLKNNEHCNMAIEDGLFPLAYITHTYQISTTVQIVLINQKHNWLNYISSSLKVKWWRTEMVSNDLSTKMYMTTLY